MTPTDPDGADRLRALDGRSVTFRQNRGAGAPIVGHLSVPPSLLPPHLACPECGATIHDESGDTHDLSHDAGCLLAQELGTERDRDERWLALLARTGQPLRYTRPTSGAEADLHESRRLPAADEPVVVSISESGGRERWWPTLDRDDLS